MELQTVGAQPMQKRWAALPAAMFLKPGIESMLD
jgi:hypothetical protein